MTEYRVGFYTKHNQGMQFDIIQARNKAEVRDIFQSNACEVISIDEVNPCFCFEVVGDNKDCPTHGYIFDKASYFSDYGSDYQERNDLYNMGMGR